MLLDQVVARRPATLEQDEIAFGLQQGAEVSPRGGDQLRGALPGALFRSSFV